MWYVIQTITGKEQELVDVLRKVPEEKSGTKNGRSFEKCFIINRECVWRRQGCYQVYIKPLFPSYIFVETDTPDKFFHDLKEIPKLTKLLGCDGSFWSVRKEEEELLRKLVGDDPEYVVRRSPIKVDENGEIVSAEGVLKEYVGRIVRKRLRKRVVVIEIPFLGEMRRVEIGVKVEGKE